MRRCGAAVLVSLTLVAMSACGGEAKGSPARFGTQRYEGTFAVLSDGDTPADLCVVVAASLPPQCEGLPIVGWNWDAVDDERRLHGTIWGAWHVTGTYDGSRFTLVGAPGQEERDSPDAVTDTDSSPACAEPDVVDASAGVAEWEAMSQDYGPFEIQHLVRAWASDPAGRWDGPFVGNVVVLPGTKAAAVALVRQHYSGALCVVERDEPTEAQLQTVQQEVADGDARAVLGPVQGTSSGIERGVVVAEVWVVDQVALDYAHDRWGNLVELRGLLDPVD